jgi:hypothetical protein
MVGPVVFNGAGLPPFAAKNVCKTPLVGGQWRPKDGGGYDLVIVDNTGAETIPDRRVDGSHRLTLFETLAGRPSGARS